MIDREIRSRGGLRVFAAWGIMVCALMAAGCAGKMPVQEQNAAGEVQDAAVIPQSLPFFAGMAGGDASLRSLKAEQEDMRVFRQRFFAPWEALKPSPSALQDFEDVLNRPEGKRGYAENMRPWDGGAWEAMKKNASLGSISGRGRAAIAVQRADLRVAPTMKPNFARVHGAGQGWPFDDFQQTAVAVGEPLMVYHESLDGAWLLVQTPLAWGWMSAGSAAFVDEAFQAQWKGESLGCVVKDAVALREGKTFLAMADIGTVLPMQGEHVLVPVRGRDGKAVISRVHAGHGDVLALPQRLSPWAVAAIGERMRGQNYGWGGMYGNRDCSAMMHDLFAPFGIWLPRHSSAQARAGEFHSLEKMTAEERTAAILRGAEPFRTLLWMSGHIGLYVGQYGGEPVFFHNIWGVRSKLRDGREGRVILGRAVITGVRPGREREDIDPGRLLIERMRGYTIMGGR